MNPCKEMQNMKQYLVFPAVIIVIGLYIIGLTLLQNRDTKPTENFDSSYIPTAAVEVETAENIIPININTATEEELCKLEGIGPVLAKRIVEKRDELGGFTGIYQISEIEGIGQKTYYGIKGYLVLE